MAFVLERNQEDRFVLQPSTDDSLIDYEELYDELFSRMEQSVGAQIRPVGENKNDGGDE